MRKTKCKECNGSGVAPDGKRGLHKCNSCQGTGEISVFTIQELRDGKVAVKNDSSIDDLNRLIIYVLCKELIVEGIYEIYLIYKGPSTYFLGVNETDLHTQNVKIFLEEIEQEEENELVKAASNMSMETIGKIMEREEPEFKWGEEVQFRMADHIPWDPAIYLCKHPFLENHHILIVGFLKGITDGLIFSCEEVRKPQKITITLSQIAEAFKCNPEQIVIPELMKL